MLFRSIIYAQEKTVLPVEVKIRETVNQRDVKKMFRFMERSNLQKALLITLDTETKFKKGTLLVEAIPYWKYWSIFENRDLS